MDVRAVRDWTFPLLRQTYTEKDTILYALGLGYGADPTDAAQLQFVYEDGLKAVPTMAATLCHPGFWLADPRTGIDATRVLHGEQRMRFHAPLAAQGRVRSETRVADIVDKGAVTGALVIVERQLFDDDSGALLATIDQRTLCRADGGFADATAPRPPAGPPAPWPERAPDVSIDIPTLPQAALLYRLCADRNPLHADPRAARAGGFDRPILHGLCTYGIAARALIQGCCGDDPAALRSLGVRFSAVVYPGDTLRTDIWVDGATARLRCSVPARDARVITDGSAEFAAAPRPTSGDKR